MICHATVHFVLAGYGEGGVALVSVSGLGLLLVREDRLLVWRRCRAVVDSLVGCLCVWGDVCGSGRGSPGGARVLVTSD